MSVHHYEKTDRSKLTEHFHIGEFHCKGTQCGCWETLHDASLSAYLQLIRNHFGKPVYITSGYRCGKHNAAIGGSANSLHIQGRAADFTIPEVDPGEIAAFAESIGVLGIGLYEDFVHIDTRSKKVFWKGHEQVPVTSFQNNASRVIRLTMTVQPDGQVSIQAE